MAERRIRPDLVLCSTAERTRQTWQRAQRAGVRARDVRFSDQVYEASSYELLRLVHSVPDEVRTLLVIGHGPGLPDLAERLAVDSTAEPARRMRLKFPTSGLAVFAVTAPWAELHEASLLDFVVPRG